mmetsp:Transcript_53222/g.119467  ORF Transcript_53222/g.119467 Transcript_53222/m.119467 type:complete len:136 (-) Transcript_53222:353-760(-)
MSRLPPASMCARGYKGLWGGVLHAGDPQMHTGRGVRMAGRSTTHGSESEPPAWPGAPVQSRVPSSRMCGHNTSNGHRICNKRASCCVTRACESAHPPDVPYRAVRERSFMPGGHVWRSCLAVVAVAMAGGEDEWR